MATPPEHHSTVDSSIRRIGLKVGIVGLILAALANIDAPSPYICFGLHCPSPSPLQAVPALRLIVTFPLLTAALLLGSVLLAILGFSLERRARRALQGQPAAGQVAWSQRRAVFLAKVAQVLQLLPLIVIVVASIVAVFIFLPPYVTGGSGTFSSSLHGVIAGLLLS